MPGFSDSTSNSQHLMFALNADFSGAAHPSDSNGLQFDGQLWIGSTVANANGSHVGVGRITSPNGSVTVGYQSGNITLQSVGGVSSVSGTANRITSTGGSTPVIDISAAYVGQTSITTLGTIATGVWQGTAVGAGFGGTGLSTYAAGDLVYAATLNPTALTKLSVPSNVWQVGTNLEYNGTSPSYFDFSKEIFVEDDFISGGINDGRIGNNCWNVSNSGSATVTANDIVDPSHPGMICMHLGTDIFVPCAVFLGFNTMTFSGGRVVVSFIAKLSALSDNVNNRYNVWIGFINSNANPTTGVYFTYIDNINSGKWQIVANTNSTATTTNTTVTADTNWHKYTIDINASATLATFYIDGTSVGTIATNIPQSSASTSLCGPGMTIANNGTHATDAVLYMDAFQMYQLLTTQR